MIFDTQYTPALREHNMMYYFLPPSMGGYSDLAPVQELVDSYIMLNGKGIKEAGSGYNAASPYENRDPRLAATVMYTGNSYTFADGSKVEIDCSSASSRDGYNTTSDVTPTGFYLKKWWDNTYRLTLQSGLNPIIIRYADILLMNAEAYAELGQMSETVWNKTIKPIRQRAGFTEASALDYNASADIKEVVFNYVGNWNIAVAVSDKAEWLNVVYDAENNCLKYTAETNTGAKREAVAAEKAERKAAADAAKASMKKIQQSVEKTTLGDIAGLAELKAQLEKK